MDPPMVRKLALIVLTLVLGLALWLSRGARAPAPVAPPRVEESSRGDAPHSPVSIPESQRAPESAASVAQTLLVVICRAKETGAPLSGQQVHLYAELKPGPIPEGNGAHGKLGELLVTGADGRVEYEVVPALALHLTTNSQAFGASAYGQREIEPLAPGETREVVLELATQDDAHFHARVIARETKQPIGVAEVQGGPRGIQTDADGRFDLAYKSWSMTRLTIAALGYAPCVLHAQEGHETPEKAMQFELDRACTLIGQLKDAGSGKYVLQAWTEGYRLQEQDPSSFMGFDTGDRQWRADFDATGRAEIPGLPPNAPLRICVFEGEKTVVELAERVTIPPGATREVELHAASTCRLTGIVRDDAGDVVPGLTLWLLRSEHGLRLYINAYEGDARVGTAKTDEQGRFAFEKLSPGSWRVTPEARARVRGADVAADEIAPVATLVEIATGEATHDVQLVVHRGLAIRGSVLDPEGKPVARSGVQGFAPGTYVGATSKEDGTFVLGPLPTGSFLLTGDSFGSGFAPSEHVRAEAGANGVVLKLRRGGKLAGRVIDAGSGDGTVAQVSISIPADPLSVIHMPTSKPDGSFEISGLLPGAYAICAAAADGRVGSLRGVELATGADLHDLVIQLAPGARVRVHYGGAEGFCSVRILQEGVVVATDGVEKGTSKTFSSPAGAVKVVCRLGGNGKEIVRELTLAVGAENEVVIDDKD